MNMKKEVFIKLLLEECMAGFLKYFLIYNLPFRVIAFLYMSRRTL